MFNNNMRIIPIIGLAYSRDIIQDPVGWSTYCYENQKSYGNIGIITDIKILKHTSIYCSIGLIERAKGRIKFNF